MDKIILKDASFLCYIGITEEEQKNAQEIFLDLELEFDTKKAGQSDDLADTIDYFSLYQGLKNLLEIKKYNLVERLAQDTADYIFKNYQVKKIKIKAKKPEAILGRAKYAGIEIERKK